MADVRINALSTTATSAASDDYLALDGSANGTRKILATNVAQNVTDVTFGSGGPSAKSSIAARAARQGLVFDGTAGATGTAVTIGTADLTFTQWIRVPSTVSTTRGLFLFSPAGGVGGTSLVGYLDSDDTLNIHITGTTSGDRSKQTLSGFVTSYAGKLVNLLFTRVGSTWTGFINGVATTFTASTSGTPPTWAGSISGSVVNIGSLGSSGAIYNDAISVSYLYNRALSAAEVVSLYEAGVPSGADYNSASNTSIITGANSDFSSDTGYWTKGNGATISGGKANLTGGANSNISRANLTTLGKRFRMTLTVGTADGTAYISDGNVTTLATGAVAGFGSTGTKTFEFTVPTSALTGIQIVSPAGTLVLDDILLYPVGLLLAPDASQAGGGLTWYDTSGNATNITLPASGVTWNVPSSLKTASGWTFGGTVLAGTAAAQGILASKNGSRFISLFSTSGGNGAVLFDSTSALRFGTSTDETGSGFSELARLTASGNVLLKGDGVDSGNGKIQLATHTTSAGGIGFGTSDSLYRAAAGTLRSDAASGEGVFQLAMAGTPKVELRSNGSNTYVSGVGALVLTTAGITGTGTTALTLDSSQRTILSGALRLNNAYTASVVTPTGYVTIQDSTGTTYKVCVLL